MRRHKQPLRGLINVMQAFVLIVRSTITLLMKALMMNNDNNLMMMMMMSFLSKGKSIDFYANRG